MRRSDVNEILTQLYFRLNGYFTTGLILHSPEWGQTRTEIDCLAIRHAFHSQAERNVNTDGFLSVEEGQTDLVICEVKSDVELLRFNPPLSNDREALVAALRWAGIFSPRQLDSVADQLRPLLDENTPCETVRAGVAEGSFRVRPLLCCPSHFEIIKGRWVLLGSEIFGFMQKCFNPAAKRPSCSTRYNFQQWGYPFAQVVKYLKDGGAANGLEGLYRNLGADF